GNFNDKTKAIQSSFSEYLKNIRTGRASPALVSDIEIEAYGSKTPLSQLASIGVQDAKTLLIEPWDKSIVKDIEKGIIASEKNLAPSVDGSGIRINIPEMTEESRKEIVKSMNQELEQAKVGIRKAREEEKKSIESQEKQGNLTEDDKRDEIKSLDEDTKKAADDMDNLAKEKEKEIMTL
ncbi:MAG: ribosome recycling factor, partial [Patescibacteria group bacterium]|nr:ribosome recycling factor [Patescibacteria group bacterium]